MPSAGPQDGSRALGGEAWWRTPVRTVMVTLLVSVACVAVTGGLEGALALAMGRLPSRIWRSAVQDYYLLWERRIVQFLPECARYDEELTYTLRPGGCRFRGREFSVDLRVNHLAFRATEEAIDSPTVIVSGDSYAMGWGVAEEQTFASLVEQRTGLRTLNAGMPSFGTARELLALRRVNLSRTRYLIIQYCDNDFRENLEFVKRGGRLAILTRTEYDSLVADHGRLTAYYPGKHLRRLLPIFRDRWLLRDEATAASVRRDHQRQAEAFLQVLRASPVPLEHLQMIAFELMPRARNDSSFVAHVRDQIARGDYPPWIREMTLLDMSPHLSEADYFFYDDHINASGHAKVATLLARAIEATETGARGRAGAGRTGTTPP
jgi:hypothetical protein